MRTTQVILEDLATAVSLAIKSNYHPTDRAEVERLVSEYNTAAVAEGFVTKDEVEAIVAAQN